MATEDESIASRAERVIENLSVAVLLIGPELTVEYANPAAEMLFETSKRNMLGMPAESLLHCPGGDVTASLHQAIETRQPFTERETTLSLPTGRDIVVDCTVLPMGNRVARHELLVEIQQVDRHLRISREEHLIAQQNATRELVRSLAHEIKNPLGGLRDAAQLLEGELPEPDLREYTRVIINEADRLQLLVNRLLGPSKLPAVGPVNIHSTLERVAQLVEAESAERLKVVRDYDPSIPDVSGDSDQLIQALLNIVRNAARAAGEAGVVVLRSRVQRQFTIGSTRHRLVAQIDVVDNGPGIPPELVDKIFFPMVSTSEGGSGLGLSIAQSLVSRHGGLIECRSKPGETVFTVFLPLESTDE